MGHELEQVLDFSKKLGRKYQELKKHYKGLQETHSREVAQMEAEKEKA